MSANVSPRHHPSLRTVTVAAVVVAGVALGPTAVDAVRNEPAPVATRAAYVDHIVAQPPGVPGGYASLRLTVSNRSRQAREIQLRVREVSNVTVDEAGHFRNQYTDVEPIAEPGSPEERAVSVNTSSITFGLVPPGTTRTAAVWVPEVAAGPFANPAHGSLVVESNGARVSRDVGF